MSSSPPLSSRPLAAAASLSEEAVIKAAIKVLRRCGVDGFNMRVLAQELGVTPGAAYRHVGGKERVLALAAEQVMSAMQVNDDPTLTWQQGLFEAGKAYRQECARYPGLAGYLVQHMHDSATNQRLLGLGARWMQQAGIAEQDIEMTARVFNAFVGASVGTPAAAAALRRGRPALAASGPLAAGLSDVDFEYGLRLLIRGIEDRDQDGRYARHDSLVGE